MSTKRRCVGSVSAEAFVIFSQREDGESCSGLLWRDSREEPDRLSDCDPETWTNVCAVPDVSVVPVSPHSVVRKYFHSFGICQAFIFVAFCVTGDVIEH